MDRVVHDSSIVTPSDFTVKVGIPRALWDKTPKRGIAKMLTKEIEEQVGKHTQLFGQSQEVKVACVHLAYNNGKVIKLLLDKVK